MEAVDILEQVFKYASPFLAAGLTYLALGRQKKADMLAAERLDAFKTVQASLVGLKHYCEASAGELTGGDLSPTREGLSAEIPRSALSQADALRAVIDRNLIFFPRAARKEFDELVGRVRLLASMELALAADTSLNAEGDAYANTIEHVEKCLERLYSELKLPR